MGLSKEALEERRGYLNASEIASIFNLHPWITQSQMWAEKKYKLLPESSKTWMTAGNKLEPVILDDLEEKIGETLERDNLRQNLPGTIFACTFDGRNDNTVGDAKFITGWYKSDDQLQRFGDPGTNEVPAYILFQLNLQMLVNGSEIGHVNCLHGGRGSFDHYPLLRNEGLIEQMMTAGNLWWDRYILGDEMPDGDVPLSTTRLLVPDKGKRVELDYDSVARWIEATEKRLDAEKEEALAKAAVASQMLDAEWGIYDPSMEKVVHFPVVSRKGHVVKASESRVIKRKQLPKGFFDEE